MITSGTENTIVKRQPEIIKPVNFYQPPTQTQPENVGAASKAGDAAQRENAFKLKLLNTPTSLAQSPNDAAAEQRASDLINQRGGVGDVSEGEARGIGKDIAEIAKTDPALAVAVMNKVQEKLNDTDKGDNVADGFIAFSSDADLSRVAQTDGGVRC